MNQIVKVDHNDFGLEESRAKQIAQQFQPMLDAMVELEQEYNNVIKLPPEEPESAKAARELRLKLVKVRTGTAKIHKEQKAFYLAAGKYIDGWKNAQLFASQGLEENLEAIEKYQENLEKERLAQLREDRVAMFAEYDIDLTHVKVEEMDEDVFNNFLNGTKMAHEQKLEAERKAREAELEAQRKRELNDQRSKEAYLKYGQFIGDDVPDFGEMDDKEWSDYIADLQSKKDAHTKEQERIRKEKEAIEKKLEAERKKRAEEEKKRKVKEEKERKEREEREAKLRAEHEAKLKAEREAREKLEREAQQRREAEAKEQARIEAERKQREKEEKAKAAAPDKDKLADLAERLKSITLPEVKTEEAIKIVSGVETMIGKMVAYINQQKNAI